MQNRHSSILQVFVSHEFLLYYSYIRYKTFDQGAASDYNRDVPSLSKPNYSAGSHA
ncbi:hypothetical protein CBM2637_B140106 [Cupriavidus taiwanensis]|nr:hypothetical protein CBM2637_B140106 [Cupriavidus taiwanensis]